MIDIVVGGQFGDEGKGSVAAQLAYENDYDFAIRVGGSNAEHRFKTPDGKSYTSRVIPTAAWIDPDLALYLGAGHVIRLDTLQEEIKSLIDRFGPDNVRQRLWIDPQAAIVPKDIGDHSPNAWRGTTHQGVGRTAAAKARRDGSSLLAKDYPEISEYVSTEVYAKVQEKLKDGGLGLLEGNQGVLLSLNHGYYPYCTAKDTTPAGLLAEAGIPISAVRHVYAIYRAVPMRVPGNSGPVADDSRELTWEELEEAMGKTLPEKAKRQTDSGDRERVFTWSWEDYRKSLALTGPDRIILTFIDWWAPALNGGADIYQHIKRMEREAGGQAPVILLRDGPDWDDFVKREDFEDLFGGIPKQ